MKNLSTFALMVLVVASLSACGKQGAAKTEAQSQNTTTGTVTSLAKTLKATCLMPDVEAGWKEASVDDLKKTPSKVVYVMSGMVTNGVVLRKDGQTSSANATLGATVNEKFELADMKQDVPCSDLHEGDEMALKGMPVLAFSPYNGAYARRLAYLYNLSPASKTEDNQAKDFEPAKVGSFYDDLSSPQILQIMKSQGDEFIEKYFRNERGDLEVRMTAATPVLQDGSRKIMSAAVRYTANVVEQKQK